jgi:hypothetical protein
VEVTKFKSTVTGIALTCMLGISLSTFSASPLISDAIGRLLADLVRTSLEYDLYNTRCRGVGASTKTDDINRLFLEKYRLTVSQVINLYIGEDERAERASMERDFMERIIRMGGCKMAKEKGLQEALDQNYRQLVDQISNLP